MLFNKLQNRKIYFIKRNFQSRFILRFVAIATVWAATAVLLFRYLAGEKLDSIRYASYVDVKTTGELLLPITVGTLAASLLIFAGILAYTIHSLWKRLSPPLHSIKKDMARIARGDLTCEVCLSTGEEFQDLAADLDGMRKELRQKIIKIRKQQQVLSAAADDFNRSIIEGKPSPTYASSLQSAVAQMKEYIQTFHY